MTMPRFTLMISNARLTAFTAPPHRCSRPTLPAPSSPPALVPPLRNHRHVARRAGRAPPTAGNQQAGTAAVVLVVAGGTVTDAADADADPAGAPPESEAAPDGASLA